MKRFGDWSDEQTLMPSPHSVFDAGMPAEHRALLFEQLLRAEASDQPLADAVNTKRVADLNLVMWPYAFGPNS